MATATVMSTRAATTASAILTLLGAAGVEGEVFNIGAENERSVLEIADVLLAQTGKPKSLLAHVVDRPGHDRRYAVDFSKLQWVLKPDDPATPAIDPVAIQYGAFINTVIQFLIVAFVVFLLVRAVNRLRREQPAEPASPCRSCPPGRFRGTGAGHATHRTAPATSPADRSARFRSR